MNRGRLLLPGAIAIAAILFLLPAARGRVGGSSADPRKKTRVGLVFDLGGRGDKSFNDAAYAGLSRAESELGVTVRFLEPSGSEDRESGLRMFAAQGFDLMIGVGFIFSSDVDAVALSYPGSKFACIDYAPGQNGIPPNVAALAFREEEGSFLVGAVAGLLTRSRHVGFVGGMTGPLIRKFEVGYDAGVKASCPTCVVHSAYAGSTPDAYRDPARGKALAISQISLGADVVYHASGATGHGVFEAANDANVMAIGVDADQHDEMPRAVVTSMVKRGDVAVFEAVRAVVEGRFKGGMQVFGLKEGGVDFVHEGPHAARIPDDVKAAVAKLREEVVSGARAVPDR